MNQVRQIHQPPIFGMTTFQELTATQWRNRINDYSSGMYTKEFLKNKTAKELAQIQNGKSYGVSESKSAAGSKPMSAIRAKLEAIKKQKEDICHPEREVCKLQRAAASCRSEQTRQGSSAQTRGSLQRANLPKQRMRLRISSRS